MTDMRTTSNVVYNATERKVFADAAMAKHVGLNNADERIKHISRLTAKGLEHSEKMLRESLTALQVSRANCYKETDPNYFLLSPSKHPKPPPKGTVLLIPDPLSAVKFIIEIRHQFIENINAAINLVLKGSRATGETEDDDPDYREMDADALDDNGDYVPDFSGGVK